LALSETDLGREAEALAAGLLRRAGLTVLGANLRTPGGELDLVAWEGNTLVFVEVKGRSALGHGLPQEAVDRRKRERLTRAAQGYLQRLPPPLPVCRFDVVAVDFAKGRASLRHLPDAFRPGD
jgi:putative endonuclease